MSRLAMSENRRIAVNIAATYGRSLFALACALFTSRWVLMALGETDYGLMGVVGSMLAFMTFVNGVLAMSTARFFAFSTGNMRTAVDPGPALEECRRWFSLSVMVHVGLAVAFVLVCWPLGEWAVAHWLKIPADRIQACLTVFRYSCITSFVGIATVPFGAMYVAKQEICLVTLSSVMTSLYLVAVSSYMVAHPGDWLADFNGLMCISGTLPGFAYAYYGWRNFPECRFRLRYVLDGHRLAEFFRFAAWAFVGPLGLLLRSQGLMVLVNRSFLPADNAALALARNLSERANTLATSVKGAMAPAVVQACGSGDQRRMAGLVFRMCKFSLATSLLFSVPLALELPEVLRLWLKNPPPLLAALSVCLIVEYLVMVSTSGYDTAVYATGRIALYEAVAGVFSILTLPAVYLCIRLGGGMVVATWVCVAMVTAYSLVRMLLSSRITGMCARDWVRGLLAPSLVAAAAAVAAGSCSVVLLRPGFGRLLLTTTVSGGVFVVLSWVLLFDAVERQLVRERVLRHLGMVGR